MWPLDFRLPTRSARVEFTARSAPCGALRRNDGGASLAPPYLETCYERPNRPLAVTVVSWNLPYGAATMLIPLTTRAQGRRVFSPSPDTLAPTSGRCAEACHAGA